MSPSIFLTFSESLYYKTSFPFKTSQGVSFIMIVFYNRETQFLDKRTPGGGTIIEDSKILTGFIFYVDKF